MGEREGFDDAKDKKHTNLTTRMFIMDDYD
jgi:hypothetical protein